MSFLSGKAYYRFSQIFGVLLVPATLLVLFGIRVEDKVSSPGIVESVDQLIVRSAIKETVAKKVYKENGDHVLKGEIVVEFEDVHGYRYSAEKTSVNLQALKDTYERLKPLQVAGSVTEAKIREMEFEIRALELEIKDLREKADRLLVRSPLDGKIINVFIKEYEMADVGRELFSVSALDDKYIRCMIQERHYSYIRPGMRVIIKSELYNYLLYDVYHGRVVRIGSFGEQYQDEITYRVDIALDPKAAAALKVGSSSMCEIVTDEIPLFHLLFLKRGSR
jgi:multidrug resistance efflux pump